MYKRQDKQYGEIVSALSDINAFNAGKKRDKALELVAAWLPEVEKFSKEIGRQQAYIDSLKAVSYTHLVMPLSMQLMSSLIRMAS